MVAPDAADRDGVVERLLAGGAHGRAGEGCRGHRRVVDDAVDDHVDDVGLDLDRVGGDLGDVPGELPLAGEVLVAAVDAEVMGDGHDWPFVVRPFDGLRDRSRRGDRAGR